jgi:thiol-disulfide isomerase/thioredoxin
MAWRCALLAVPLVAASCGAGGGSDSSGVLAAEFSDYESGEPAMLGEFDGMPLVVNLWAAWCPSCIHEMPDFERVSQEYLGEVEFVGIGIDDDRGAAEQLVDETGVTYRLGFDDDGVFTDLLRIDRQLITTVGASPTFGPCKTESSVRTIPAPDLVLDELARHLEQFGPGADGLVFTDRKGDPINRTQSATSGDVQPPRPMSSGSHRTI